MQLVEQATAVAQVNTYAAITVTADAAQANQYLSTLQALPVLTLLWRKGSFTYNGSTASTSATNFAAVTQQLVL